MTFCKTVVVSVAVSAAAMLLGTSGAAVSANPKKCVELSPAKRERCEKLYRKKKLMLFDKSHDNQNRGREVESDIRLKTKIHRIGTTTYGLPLYTFEYKTRPGVYEGVMAQDVLKVKPDAVIMGTDGFYRVNYQMLGIDMLRLQ